MKYLQVVVGDATRNERVKSLSSPAFGGRRSDAFHLFCCMPRCGSPASTSETALKMELEQSERYSSMWTLLLALTFELTLKSTCAPYSSSDYTEMLESTVRHGLASKS